MYRRICTVCLAYCAPQVILSFVVFPKPLSWKYVAGGVVVAAALYALQRTGKRPPGEAGGAADKQAGGAVAAAPPLHVAAA